MNIFERIKLNIKRRANAKQFGMKYLLGRTFNFPDEIIINGRRIQLQIPEKFKSKYVFTDIFIDDEYNIKELKSEKIKTIMDIGGGFGLFSLYVRKFFPYAKLHVYEPNPECCEVLKYHAKLAKFDCFLEAIGKNEGNVSMEVPGGKIVRGRAVKCEESNIHKISFRESLARLGGYADLVKLDIEGGEWEIFEDIKSWENVKFLTMEYHLFHKKQSTEELKSIMKTIGFRIRKIKALTEDTGMLLAEK